MKCKNYFCKIIVQFTKPLYICEIIETLNLIIYGEEQQIDLGSEGILRIRDI